MIAGNLGLDGFSLTVCCMHACIHKRRGTLMHAHAYGQVEVDNLKLYDQMVLCDASLFVTISKQQQQLGFSGRSVTSISASLTARAARSI